MSFKANPRLLSRAEGMHYWTPDGRRVLDGVAGLWCVNAGHARREITEAVSRQIAEMDYAPPFQMGHPAAFELANEIVGWLPSGLDHVFFTNSGSESVDTALKIALAYHRVRGEGTRTRFIGRERGYHGVGFGGISVGGIAPNKAAFSAQLLPGVDHLPHTHDLARNAFSSVLFEIDDAPGSWEWLRTQTSRGLAIVMIGESDDTRRAAEALGYSFDEPLRDQPRVLTLTGKAALELGGTIPVSGRVLRPNKKGAQAVAFFAGTDQPGALVERSGKGSVGLMPFSFVRSARSSGSNAIYSLALRTAVRSLAPTVDEAGGTASQELIVSSPAGPVKAGRPRRKSLKSSGVW